MVDKVEGSFSIRCIVGVYDVKEGISQEFLCKVVYKVLEVVFFDDYLLVYWWCKYGLIDFGDVLWGIYFLCDEVQFVWVYGWLCFDEYLFLELWMLL